MKLLINTATTHKGGGVQVAKSFISECKNFPEHEYHIVLGLLLAKSIDTSGFPPNFYFYNIPYRPATKVFSWGGPASFFKALEKKTRFDCVITTSGPAYWRPACPHAMGYNLPHYIYRDSPFFNNITLYRRLRWFLKGIMIHYYTKRDADVYFTQTDDVKTRLQKWIGKKNIHTITNTYGEQFEIPLNLSKKILPERQANEKRFLMLSAYYANKNFQIINSIALLLEQLPQYCYKFVLTLPAEEYDTIFTDIAKKHIINIGPVQSQDCPLVYHECDAVFLPTLLECFSATYVEGMKMKKPIITTNLSFAKTVCADAALYFEPLDAADALAKITIAAEDETTRQQLIASGTKRLTMFLSAKERAAKYIALCQDIVHSNRN